MDVLPLSEAGLDDAPRVGRKAAVLGELLTAGYQVPEGWVIGAAALETEFGQGSPGRQRAGTLRERLGEVLTAAGGRAVAVRSSGVAEDLAGLSYAGQYESFVNLRGLDEVFEAVRACWASGFSERVAAYGGGAEGGVGVLIQVMVDAEVAGAAFSVNVVTLDPEEVVVSAVRGLGVRLMAGEVTAEEWAVTTDGRARRTSGEDEVATPGQIRQVAELARSVAARFGRPQNIEWAFHGGRLWLLQARPVTGVPDALVPHVPIPAQAPPGTSMRDPNFDRPWAPFVRSVLLPVLTAASPHLFAFSTGLRPRPVVIGGWPYANYWPDTAAQLMARMEEIADRVADGEPRRLIQRWHDGWKAESAGQIARLRSVTLPRLPDEGLVGHLDALREAFAVLHDRYFRLSGASAFLLGRLGHTCSELLGWEPGKTLELRGGLAGDHVPATALLGDLARLAAARPRVRAALEAGDHPVDPDFDAAFTAYLAEHGHRTPGFTLTEPTLAEQPEVVLGLVRAQLDAPYDVVAERARLAARRDAAVAEARTALSARGAADRERFETALADSDLSCSVRDEKSAHAVSLWALLRYAMLEAGSRLATRGALATRDDVLFLEYEETLAALQGTPPAVVELARHRGAYAWALAHPGPPVYGPPPRPVAAGPGLAEPSPGARAVMNAAEWTMSVFGAGAGAGRKDEGDTLYGVAASAGRYTGLARVITSAAEFGRLRAGEVLVCPQTTAQWAVLFPSVGALVTDRGSLLSHPAALAREYGVPAVVATGDATSVFHDGDLLVVDGSSGTVRRATS
ncbi:PEP/pyruvate-binding domain-containing protein [Streptomyces sp. NPDC056411]|uniref:PEP/pyruvate-binding domain-containing protein n=1 Tax=Streptomyces sp. NPDC056411 TaxID=3345813 RepID=UPI0035D83ECB